MGVWALPTTVKKAKKIQKVIDSNLTAKQASRELWSILGDDFFMDDLLFASDDGRSPNPIIKRYVKWLVKDIEKSPDNYAVKFTKQTIKALKEIK